MYWFARPPWIRWTLSTCLLVAAFALEIRGPATADHWFATTDIPAGTPLTPDQFRTVQVPTGLFPSIEPHGFARTEIYSGDPLLDGDVTDQSVRAPDDWWVIELPVPARLRVGQTVLLVVLDADTATTVGGLAVAVDPTRDPFGGTSAIGSIAVPSDAAAVVAAAAATGNVTVLTANN
ncbi:MAG: SAF domain-containing protein [Acidimicrobiia bacterium]|nr:SAF domain-containing protein [Acidimicrobiia bacterium]MDH5503035.1 SAF domain-containing protein [Acidimicrobiia bacterium]